MKKGKLIANYHTHCKYCHHAAGEVEDYIKEAINLGMEEIGMTDHAPVIPNLVEAYGAEYASYASNMSHSDIDLYLKDISNAKKKYNDKISILSGFETEYLPKGHYFYKYLRSKVDYLNLGMHYCEHENKIISPYSKGEMNYKTVKSYADACIKGMETGLFNTLVHPDLFMFCYENRAGERKFDEAAIIASRRIIESAIKNNVYLELNVNGLRDHDDDPYEYWHYPYYEFWEIVKEYPDVKILIGADAHNLEALNSIRIDKVRAFANKIGLKIDDKMKINH